jgi:hypothetical protein
MMTTNEITQIKLACLQEASKQCVMYPDKTLEVVKELFEWVMAAP